MNKSKLSLLLALALAAGNGAIAMEQQDFHAGFGEAPSGSDEESYWRQLPPVANQQTHGQIPITGGTWGRMGNEDRYKDLYGVAEEKPEYHQPPQSNSTAPGQISTSYGQLGTSHSSLGENSTPSLSNLSSYRDEPSSSVGSGYGNVRTPQQHGSGYDSVGSYGSAELDTPSDITYTLVNTTSSKLHIKIRQQRDANDLSPSTHAKTLDPQEQQRTTHLFDDRDFHVTISKGNADVAKLTYTVNQFLDLIFNGKNEGLASIIKPLEDAEAYLLQ